MHSGKRRIKKSNKTWIRLAQNMIQERKTMSINTHHWCAFYTIKICCFYHQQEGLHQQPKLQVKYYRVIKLILVNIGTRWLLKCTRLQGHTNILIIKTFFWERIVGGEWFSSRCFSFGVFLYSTVVKRWVGWVSNVMECRVPSCRSKKNS